MSAMTTDDGLEVLDGIKRRARSTWAAGDYDAVVDGIWAAGGTVTRHTRVGPRDEVLDVACGTGNATVQAAQAGAKVVGLDLTPELFPAARRRAAEAGVEIELVEGDAEDVPYPDGSFDVVLSTFGVMFAPRHAVAASEMVRVLRPGGRIGLANWEPEGTVGQFFRTMARHLPPPPPIVEPPLLWGTESHVRDLLGSQVDLEFSHSHIPLESGVEPASAVDLFLDRFPPIVTARALLESQGRWEDAETEIRAAVENMYNNPPTYLGVYGTKRP